MESALFLWKGALYFVKIKGELLKKEAQKSLVTYIAEDMASAMIKWLSKEISD